jgi:Dirigent-like protein
MSRSWKAVLAAVAVLVVTVGAMSFASASSPSSSTTSSSTTKTIHVIQPASAVFTNVDVDPTGDSPGDYVVITSPLLSPATHKKVGSAAAVCTLVKVTPTFPSQCVATGSFAAGDITIQGLFRSVTGKANVLAVTGGTGAYRTARGTVTTTILNSGATDLVFRLIL